MKAIRVSHRTLGAIEKEIDPALMKIIGSYHHGMSCYQGLYVIVNRLQGDSRNSAKVTNEFRFYEDYMLDVTIGDWSRFPHEWFPIVPRSYS